MSNTAENLAGQSSDKEVLIVVSKLKNYVRNKSGLNTSGSVAEKLTEIIKELCDKAIQNATNDGRKTVMDRDFTTTAVN